METSTSGPIVSAHFNPAEIQLTERFQGPCSALRRHCDYAAYGHVPNSGDIWLHDCKMFTLSSYVVLVKAQTHEDLQ